MRTLAIIVLLAACGGSSKPVETAPLPPENVEETSPPENLAFEPTGAAACDALVMRTTCTFDKAGAAVPAESRQAFADGVEAWRDALKNEATREATIDACEMSLEAGFPGYEATGCWEIGDEYDAQAERYAGEEEEEDDDDRSVYYQWQPTGSAECDSLITRVFCTMKKAGDAFPVESVKAFHDAIPMWRDALKNDDTRQATIDACKMSLDAGKDGFAAQGC